MSLWARLSVCLSVCPSVFLSVCLSISLYHSLYLIDEGLSIITGVYILYSPRTNQQKNPFPGIRTNFEIYRGSIEVYLDRP